MESGAGRTTETTPSIDREAARLELAGVAAGGGLTLGEYAERACAIERAANVDEIESAVRGLPEGRRWRRACAAPAVGRGRAWWHRAAGPLASEQAPVVARRARRSDSPPLGGRA